MRPSPAIYARMETAHSLLSGGFQQILAGFARLLDAKTDVFQLFPNFGVVDVVHNTEKSPEKKQIEMLHKSLRAFMKDNVRFLFYKDTETVERFIEEILITKRTRTSCRSSVGLVRISKRCSARSTTAPSSKNNRLKPVMHNS
ncbi:MAG: hypothetical protein ABIP78_12025 [Pyrinomonadaceae bacterium]